MPMNHLLPDWFFSEGLYFIVQEFIWCSFVEIPSYVYQYSRWNVFAGLLCKRGHGAPAAEECCIPTEARWLFFWSHSRLLHYMVYYPSPLPFQLPFQCRQWLSLLTKTYNAKLFGVKHFRMLFFNLLFFCYFVFLLVLVSHTILWCQFLRYKYQKAVEGAMKAGSLRANGNLPRVRTELYNISFEDDRYSLFSLALSLVVFCE